MQTESLTTKPHYPILDGLRGVAAIVLVIFHIFEVHSRNRFEQIINHGYLAVDFFFLLSGFVIAYAYDDRWGKMTLKDFFQRRLIRLQPLVVLGALIGALLYFPQASDAFPVIRNVSFLNLLGITLLGMFLIPSLPSMNIRGWGEMFTLNGPSWSLFYEYIANILYALFFRKASKLILGVFVFASACFLIHFTLTSPRWDLSAGWVFNPRHIHTAFARLLFPFFAGVLICRCMKLIKVKNAFLLCSTTLIIVLSMPRLGGRTDGWINGVYELFALIIIFPLIVYIGASGEITGRNSTRLCKFLGDISFPIYITHYPFVLLYWAHFRRSSFEASLIFGVLTLIVCLITAYLCLKYYDEPVRKWLSQKGIIANLKITPKP